MVKSKLRPYLKNRYDIDAKNLSQEVLWWKFLRDIKDSLGGSIGNDYLTSERDRSGRDGPTRIKTNILGKWSESGTERREDIAFLAYYYAHTCIDTELGNPANEIDVAFIGEPFEDRFGEPVPRTVVAAEQLIALEKHRKKHKDAEPISPAPATDVPKERPSLSEAPETAIPPVFWKQKRFIICVAALCVAVLSILATRPGEVSGSLDYNVRIVDRAGNIGTSDLGQGHTFSRDQSLELRFHPGDETERLQAALYSITSSAGHAKLTQVFDVSPGSHSSILIETLANHVNAPFHKLVFDVRQCNRICRMIWRFPKEAVFDEPMHTALPRDQIELDESSKWILFFEPSE